MPRSASGAKTAEAIREAAAESFYRHGYEATTLRDVAATVGIQVGSLYNHIKGKDTLLRTIMVGIMDDLLAAQQDALKGVEDPADRLHAAVDCHVRFHATRARDVFVGNSELRALSPADRRKVIARRDKYEVKFRELVDALAADGRGDILDTRLQTYALLAMGSHVSTWYRPDGDRSLDEIVEIYTTMALRQLGLAAGARSTRRRAKA